MALDARERRFVEEYLVDLDPKRAAIAAGYSATMAASKAYQWVSNGKVKPAVFAAIAVAKEARAKRTEITADRVLKELAKIGFSDIRKAVKWGSRFVERAEGKRGDDESDALYVTTVEMIDSSELDDATAAAVAEVAQTKEGVRIKLHDKKGALVDIGRHLGMFTDKVDHTSSDGSMTPRPTVIEFVAPDAGKD